jgi:DNA polymerase-3 subunit gamma/tau
MDSSADILTADKSEYRVLARKYRPKLFKDIVAQDHIVRVIRNSLQEDKIHHAFLLTGIRGAGKTTLARLMAMAINCEDLTKDGEIEPCLKCSSCVAIAAGNQQDIIEIDAASNTGVNDVREIIENSKYQPIGVKCKVFIIDEVHMLSNSAFNALLKSLEEPPTHTKFILATTELQKVPLTIISRCQRLDLHRFNFKDLVSYLEKIAKLEKFTLDKKAAHILAKSAQGSARDALSMLDQALLCANDEQIKITDVEKMLGISSVDVIYKIFSALLAGDIKNILENIRSLYDKGANLAYALADLAEIAHKISLYLVDDSQDIFISDVEKSFCRKHAQDTSLVTLTRLWQMLQKSLNELKNSANELISIEMSMIKIVHANLAMSPEELLVSFEQHGGDAEAVVKKKVI